MGWRKSNRLGLHLPCFPIWCGQRSRHRRNTVRIRKLRWFIACLHAAIQKLDKRIADIQASCRHTWRIHSQRKTSNGTWWIHRECTVCESAQSDQYESPICPGCMGTLADQVPLTEKTRERATASAASPAFRYASVWMYHCPTCDSLHAFPVQDDTKKPPSG